MPNIHAWISSVISGAASGAGVSPAAGTSVLSTVTVGAVVSVAAGVGGTSVAATAAVGDGAADSGVATTSGDVSSSVVGVGSGSGGGLVRGVLNATLGVGRDPPSDSVDATVKP